MKAKTTFKILYVIFVAILFGKAYAFQELRSLDVPSHFSINMSQDVKMKLLADMRSIAKDENPIQNPLGKIEYKAEIEYVEDGAKKFCEAKVKINGDYKDHINDALGIASFRIGLNKGCSISGVTKFKLLLPETRNNDDEIYMSLVLKKLGFPVLDERYVSVQFGGIKYKAIFVEGPNNRFLERFGIRESPIIEIDERQLWENRYLHFEYVNNNKSSYINNVFAPFNKEYKNAPVENFNINYTGKIENTEFLSDKLNLTVASNALSQLVNSPNILNEKIFVDLMQQYGGHGLGHNRKFIYLPYLNAYVPLYYDGDISVKVSASCDNKMEILPDANFVSEFKQRTGSQLTEEQKCTYSRIASAYGDISWSIENIFRSSRPLIYVNRQELPSYPSGLRDVLNNYVYYDAPSFYMTTGGGKSEPVIIDEKTAKKAFSGNVVQMKEKYPVFVLSYGNRKAYVKNSSEFISESGLYEFHVPNGEVKFIYKAPFTDADIKINLQGFGAKVVFSGAFGSVDSIDIKGGAVDNLTSERHDQLMLTGCLTFYNTTFSGGRINSEAIGCEDSVNFLNSKGSIDRIMVMNATADAIDADFSYLEFSDVTVDGAGNDCMDLSAGNYSVKNAILASCLDKGVSAGESAVVNMNTVSVNSAGIGVASKDAAIVHIKQFEAVSIEDKCDAKYNKKIGYKKSSLSIDSLKCITR